MGPLLLALLIPLVASAAARPLAHRLEPRQATWLLCAAAVVLAGCAAAALALAAGFAAAPDFVEQYPEFTQGVVTALMSSLADLKVATDPAVVLQGMPADFQSAVKDSWSKQWELAKSGFTRATPPLSLFDNKFAIAAYQALNTPAPSGLS